MKRKRLAELVREEAGGLQEAPTPREERTGEAPHGGGLEASPKGEGPGERPLPPYLTYVRKECRLRPDQLDALTALARRLNRERKGKGERITENTLIRWAVDLLLENFSRTPYSILKEERGVTDEIAGQAKRLAEEIAQKLGLPS